MSKVSKSQAGRKQAGKKDITADEKTYRLEQRREYFFFKGARIYGRDISNIPYKRCRKSFSPFQRHCGEQMRLFRPTELPSAFDDECTLTIVRCDTCRLIQARYMLEGFA